MIDILAFDADDTLWHTEFLYTGVQKRVRELIRPYYSGDDLAERLHRIEIDNLQYYGYGIKGYILSLVEAAIEVTGGKIHGSEIQSIIQMAKEMLSAEIRFIDGALETLEVLSKKYPLMLITKGDLFEQDAKIVRSGVKPFFRYVEVVSNKDRAGYSDLLVKYGLDPHKFLMVGNSMKSDILPVIELGGWGVFVPYPESWSHEHADPPQGNHRFFEIENLRQLPALIESVLARARNL